MELGKEREETGGRRSDVEMQSEQCNAKGDNKKKHPVVRERMEKAKKAV